MLGLRSHPSIGVDACARKHPESWNPTPFVMVVSLCFAWCKFRGSQLPVSRKCTFWSLYYCQKTPESASPRIDIPCFKLSSRGKIDRKQILRFSWERKPERIPENHVFPSGMVSILPHCQTLSAFHKCFSLWTKQYENVFRHLPRYRTLFLGHRARESLLSL